MVKKAVERNKLLGNIKENFNKLARQRLSKVITDYTDELGVEYNTSQIERNLIKSTFLTLFSTDKSIQPLVDEITLNVLNNLIKEQTELGKYHKDLPSGKKLIKLIDVEIKKIIIDNLRKKGQYK